MGLKGSIEHILRRAGGMALFAMDAGSVQKRGNTKEGLMPTRISLLRSNLVFFSSFILFLVFSASALAQDATATTEITGEASVVISDDFVAGRSETRYYIIDRVKNRETRVFFNNGKPKAFATGKKVRLQGRGRPDGFEVQSVTEMDGGAGTGLDGASAAPLAGFETRNVLTILVDFNDAVVDTGTGNGINVQQARDRMFNETKSVAGWYWNSSLGTLEIPPDPDGNGVQDVFGPYKINDNYLGSSSDCTESSWVNQARSAWQTANPGKNINLYRHTLLIVPNYWDYNSGRACGWGGVAQVGCGTWCWAIGADARSIFHGVIAHELGHNFGFQHASTDTNNDGVIDSEYGDESDTMGGDRAWMKFNAPHIEDKNWVDADNYEIRTVVPSASAQNFDLIALDEEAWDWPGLRALKVQRTGTSDYYLSYRLAAGDYNNVNEPYRNKLNIHYATDGSTRSYFVTALSPGQTFNDPYNGLIITATGEMTIDNGGLSTQVMGVQICQGVCSSVAAPGNLTATAAGTSGIDLSWSDNSDNEDGFRLEHSTNGSDWSLLADDTVTYFSHTGLATASTHYYRVQAYNAEEVSGWSNTASATTDAIPPVAAFTWVDDLLDVSFTDHSTDDGVISSWSWDFGDGGASNTANPQHSYATGGDYTVTLTVTDNHGASDSFSDLVSVTGPPFSEHFASSETTFGGSVGGSYTLTFADETGGGSAESVTERESGGKPSSRHSWLEHQWTFNIPAGQQTVLTVNAWHDDNPDNDHFDFEFSTNGNSWTPMFTVDNADTDAIYYQDLTGVSGTVYIRVLDTDQGQGNRSLDTVYVDYMMIRVDNDAGGEKPDGNPSGLSAEVAGPDQVNLAWTDGSGNETGFRVERRVKGQSVWSNAGETGANATSFQDTGLAPSTTYEYRVFAFNFSGDSVEPTNMIEVTTDDAPPPPDVELFIAANKDRGKHVPTLTWIPAGSNMDVYFNGGSSPIAIDVASGWSHETGNKGGASYTYEVCVTGATTACSGQATVNY
jgi:PKD repeat protein